MQVGAAHSRGDDGEGGDELGALEGHGEGLVVQLAPHAPSDDEAVRVRVRVRVRVGVGVRVSEVVVRHLPKVRAHSTTKAPVPTRQKTAA